MLNQDTPKKLGRDWKRSKTIWMKKISPVEWLFEMLSNPNRRPSERIKILEKAKKMEKEQQENSINNLPIHNKIT